jgi:predicted Zn-dependent protease with MMP-like domain
MRFSVEDVERLVGQALDELPEDFARLLDNVVVMVEEEPTDEDLESVGMSGDEGDELFGLYQGVPLTERDTFYDSLPDRVVIYAGPIRRAFDDPREAVEEIKKTVVHELGHFFGMEEDQMPW